MKPIQPEVKTQPGKFQILLDFYKVVINWKWGLRAVLDKQFQVKQQFLNFLLAQQHNEGQVSRAPALGADLEGIAEWLPPGSLYCSNHSQAECKELAPATAIDRQDAKMWPQGASPNCSSSQAECRKLGFWTSSKNHWLCLCTGDHVYCCNSSFCNWISTSCSLNCDPTPPLRVMTLTLGTAEL